MSLEALCIHQNGLTRRVLIVALSCFKHEHNLALDSSAFFSGWSSSSITTRNVNYGLSAHKSTLTSSARALSCGLRPRQAIHGVLAFCDIATGKASHSSDQRMKVGAFTSNAIEALTCRIPGLTTANETGTRHHRSRRHLELGAVILSGVARSSSEQAKRFEITKGCEGIIGV